MSKSVYTWAGVSTHNGETKLRFANSGKRAAHLERVGHTDVRLAAMPFEGDTADAVDFLLSQDWAKDLPCVREAAKELGFLVQGEATEEVATAEAG